MGPRTTTAILSKLRELMQNTKYVTEKLQAYIITSDDAHQSEYVSDRDKRRGFVSGFDGSAGTAVVTLKQAALWTDGRYYLQATSQMDENWALMKDGLPETPNIATWLNKVLPPESKVGVDPFLASAETFMKLKKSLCMDGHTLVPVQRNLVDLVWANEQPPRPCNPLIVMPLSHTGVAWEDKVADVRARMTKDNASMFVATALDDIAWLLNLRGSDIEYNPVFFAYVLVTMTDVHLFIDAAKVEAPAVREHLKSDKIKLLIHAYEDIVVQLQLLAEKQADKIWISSKSSQALFQLVPKRKLRNEPSLLAVMKSVKNDSELAGMVRAQLKDAIAIAEFFAWLEKEVPKGTVTEVSGAEKVDDLRREQGALGPSFATISSSGPNGAVIHYKPTPETDRPVTTDQVYLLDSGGQYIDGTTDITRTVHLGTPTPYQQECFTRVLKGHINLATLIFPNETNGSRLECVARTGLWTAGLDYPHGTGHGVGAFLNVHEGPCSIHRRVMTDEIALREGMVMSNEPGFYEDGSFGMRIESLVTIGKATTQYNYKNKGFLCFETITPVPIQRKLILPELLTEKETDWVNTFHQKCRDIVGPVLKEQGRKEALAWLWRETELLP